MKVEQPRRSRRSYTQNLQAPPTEVFPLLCPVGEEKWVPGWDPRLVISDSGVAEKDCVFITPGSPAAAIWVVTGYNPTDFSLEMYKITPDHTVGRLDISLTASGSSATRAEVTYTYTSLGGAGDTFLEEFTEAWYVDFMKNWERALNHYLSTGCKITGVDG